MDEPNIQDAIGYYKKNYDVGSDSWARSMKIIDFETGLYDSQEIYDYNATSLIEIGALIKQEFPIPIELFEYFKEQKVLLDQINGYKEANWTEGLVENIKVQSVGRSSSYKKHNRIYKIHSESLALGFLPFTFHIDITKWQSFGMLAYINVASGDNCDVKGIDCNHSLRYDIAKHLTNVIVGKVGRRTLVNHEGKVAHKSRLPIQVKQMFKEGFRQLLIEMLDNKHNIRPEYGKKNPSKALQLERTDKLIRDSQTIIMVDQDKLLRSMVKYYMDVKC